MAAHAPDQGDKGLITLGLYVVRLVSRSGRLEAFFLCVIEIKFESKKKTKSKCKTNKNGQRTTTSTATEIYIIYIRA